MTIGRTGGNGHDQNAGRKEDRVSVFIYGLRQRSQLLVRRNQEGQLTTNGPVRFAVDGDKSRVLDERGKEHKETVLQRALDKK